jgi:predicted protein tyrosine phosphatase
MRPKLLFVCSQNKWRSLTAEKLFAQSQDYDARSAGTERGARIKLTEGTLGWADHVFVMERKHLDRIRQYFPDIDKTKPIMVLDIADDYQFMDEELVEILKNRLSAFLEIPEQEAP